MRRSYFHARRAALLFCSAAFFSAQAAFAEGYNIGDACTDAGAFHTKNDGNGAYHLICDGSTWVLSLAFQKTGEIGIGDATPDSGTGGQLKLDVEGPAGATKYCDEAGNNCFTTSTVASGGAPALSALTAATMANTITGNADYAQAWKWTLTTAAKSGMEFGEQAAATNGVAAQSVVKMSTLAASTAMPLWILNEGAKNSLLVEDVASDASPFVIDASGNVGIGTTAPQAPFEIRTTAYPGIFLTSAVVAHGMTGLFPTDVYGYIGNTAPNNGGISIFGASDVNSAPGAELYGIIGDADPVDTTPAIFLIAGKKNGTGWQALGISETVFQLSNYSTPLITALGNGNVGIGTASPGASLHLEQSATTFNALRILNSNAGTSTQTSSYLDLGLTNSAGASYARISAQEEGNDNYAALAFGTRSGPGTPIERMRISYGGNVGIGTASPGAQLEVQIGSSSATNNALRLSNSPGFTVGTGMVFFTDTTAGTAGTYSSGRIYSAFDGTAYTTARLTFQTPTANNVWTDTMTLKNGNVGIGTTNPTAQLDLSASSETTSSFQSTVAAANNWPIIILKRARAIVASPVIVGSTDTQSNFVTQAYDGSAYISTGSIRVQGDGGTVATNRVSSFMSFFTHPDSTAAIAERMRIDSAGNVGIGTTTPAARLDVVGNINYSGQLVDVSDRTKKDNIVPLPAGQLASIMALHPVSFTMKGETDTEFGLIAQDVQPVYPALVQAVPDGTLTMNYVGLIAPMISTIQEQQQEIDRLEARLDALENRRPSSASRYND